MGMSLLYYKKTYPSSKILSFEPNSVYFELLEKNISVNKLSFITTFRSALSDCEGNTELYESNSGSLTTSLISSPGKTIKEIVSTSMLSHYILDEVDMIKMDVEGSEVEIVHDLIQSQKINLVKRMVIEFHPVNTKTSVEKFTETICQNNYQCLSEKDHLHPGATEWMISCIKKK